MRFNYKMFVLFLVMAVTTVAVAGSKKSQPPKDQPAQVDPNADKIFYQEAKLVENMHKFTPMVETYIQNMKPDEELGSVPASDKYFLGRLVLNEKGINDVKFTDKQKQGFFSRVLDRLIS